MKDGKSKRGAVEKAIIVIASMVLVYLLISLYFTNHFFTNTVINGVNVSLKSLKDVDQSLQDHIRNYKLQLVERNGEIEELWGKEIGLEYNDKNNISEILRQQDSLKWIILLFRNHEEYTGGVFFYNETALEDKINNLHCINNLRIEPRNVDFKYSGGSYELVEEVYGNIVRKDRLYIAIRSGILMGETTLDLNEKHCYENPQYTLISDKAFETKKLLDKYVTTSVTYSFDNLKEQLDGNMIHKWLSVDDDLDVKLDRPEVKKYVKELGEKYDTVGIARNFKTSTGKIIEVQGGLYGWKIDQKAETEALLENIKNGQILIREPVYAQRALFRSENEIGNTYVEINITKQHLWFYKDGKLIIHGPVVTGNPNTGNSTVTGTNMLNYKQKDAVLSGPGYQAPVTYWMPFYGNIGVHDARWRRSFGGEIYKRNGSHGCVNAPFYLAKIIFEQIGEGTPFISYKE
ncbi:peptidoglycan binding domain-containing protein [Lacrimispora sp. BS-2]|uniref:Peptidoglycan binding domain-containing protein n=1 Tax=Lacrimispora sp. BS-2 TaxID=3151850 RepID=A0AAU7PT66_9FIRM